MGSQDDCSGTVFYQLIVNKICRWLDLNHGSLVSEATALPTMPQPLPYVVAKFTQKNVIIESHFTAMDALSHCLVVIGVDS